MTPTQRRAEFKRLALKIVNLEKQLEKTTLDFGGFAARIVHALELKGAPLDVLEKRIADEIKRLKAIEKAVNGE